MSMVKEKAPRKAATFQSAENEHIQDKVTTEPPKKQGDFRPAVVLDDVGTRLEMAANLLAIIVESLEDEISIDSGPAVALRNRVEYYTDSLLILREFLLDIQREAKGGEA